jgi:hypothetical protein
MGLPRCFIPLVIEAEVEDRTFAGFGFQPDAATVAFYDLLDKGEADSGAVFLPVGRILQPLEDAENFMMVFGIDTDTVVLDVKDVSFQPLIGVDRLQKSDFDNSLGLVVVFDRIGYEIAEHLGHPRLIADDSR